MEKEIRDFFKTKDVSLKDLLIRVHDTKTGKDGWLDFEELIDSIASQFTGSGNYNKKDKSIIDDNPTIDSSYTGATHE